MASRDEFEEANRHSKELQARLPRAISARYDPKNRRIVLQLNSKLIVSFSPDDVEGLAGALPSQLNKVEISLCGFGICFPAIVDAEASMKVLH